MQSKNNSSILTEDRMEELPFRDDESNTTEENMENEPDYSMIDYCDGSCQELVDSYLLIDSLVQDILSLEEEMVRWRQALMKHLSPVDAQNLQSDIYDNLACRHYDNECYQKYVNRLYHGVDPMESEEHFRMLRRLRDGMDETSVTL